MFLKKFPTFLKLVMLFKLLLTFAHPCLCQSDYFEAEQRPIGSPFFIEEPQNITTRIGERVILNCRVANANEAIQWTRGGFGLGTKEHISEWGNLKILDSNPETDWNLEINPVTLDDDAEFQCQVPIARLQSRIAYLNVWVPPEEPRIPDGPVVQVKENVEIALRCESRGGKPAAKINWFDENGNLMNDASYNSRKMRDSKLFEAVSMVKIIPTKEHHNVSLRCHAWNEAAENLRPASVRLHVLYAPSVTVTPVKPGMVEEGHEAIFRCTAVANPPVYENSYKWYIDDKEVKGQFGFYFKILNVTRTYHDKHVMCRVENELGMASGIRTIEVKYGPSMIQQPRTVSGDRMSRIVLHCVVDSSPMPKYFWTRGASREIISYDQNLTLTVSEETVGTYICHADTEGFPTVMSRPAEVLMTGPPRITTTPIQTGTVGDNVHINCAAISIPEAKEVFWKYHGETIDDGNAHYRIINSPIEHGIRSTLIIRQALQTDFGPYTCSLKNSHGYSSFDIRLEEQQPFPLQFVVISILALIAIVMVLAAGIVMYRKRGCCLSYTSKKSDSSISLDGRTVNNGALAAANNAIMKVNNLDQFTYDSVHIKRDLHSPSASNENDSLRDGSETADSTFRASNNNCSVPFATQLNYNTTEMETDFPPKPDVISGYVSNSHFVRDLYPPGLIPGQESSLYNTFNPNTNSRQSSMLNVSDPRFSATYGNPYLRQPSRGSMQYSTFCPPGYSPASNVMFSAGNSTFHPSSTNTLPSSSSLIGSNSAQSFPMMSVNQMSLSTPSPNSNHSQKLEETSLGGSDTMKLNGISVMPLKNDSPSPPPPPMAQTATQIPIYAKVNNTRQTSSPRIDLLPSPGIQGNEIPGGLLVSSTLNGNSSIYPLHYHGNGSLPRHTIQSSYVFKNDQGPQGGATSSGLATRV